MKSLILLVGTLFFQNALASTPDVLNYEGTVQYKYTTAKISLALQKKKESGSLTEYQGSFIYNAVKPAYAKATLEIRNGMASLAMESFLETNNQVYLVVGGLPSDLTGSAQITGVVSFFRQYCGNSNQDCRWVEDEGVATLSRTGAELAHSLK